MVARVAVIGSINMDLVVATEALPRPGETVLGRELHRFGGGKGANQAIAAARMGATVAMVGRVGDDDFGRALLGAIRADGIDVSAVGRVDEPTGTALITVDADGTNTIVVVPGANGTLGSAHVEAARQTIEASDAVLLQLEVPIEANVTAARIARQAGVAVFLNPSPVAPLPNELLGSVSYLVLNETELARLAGSSAEPSALLERGVHAVVLTLGERGARLISGSGERAVEPYRVDPIDSTAAGDAFLGALAATASEHGIEPALRFAAAAGALATTRWGAQLSLPTRAEVDELIEYT